MSYGSIKAPRKKAIPSLVETRHGRNLFGIYQGGLLINFLVVIVLTNKKDIHSKDSEQGHTNHKDIRHYYSSEEQTTKEAKEEQQESQVFH
jgi:hypothetical protein